MKLNPSREQLSRSLDRRIKHLMIQTLEQFEDKFPELDAIREGQIFKGDLRNAFNDVMRAQKTELMDYEIEYRPFQSTNENSLVVTQTFMRAIQNIEFAFLNSIPRFIVYAHVDKMSVLEALRSEFECGLITLSDNQGLAFLEIIGIEDCVKYVIPRMDKYCLHPSVRADYKTWRDAVGVIYRS